MKYEPIFSFRNFSSSSRRWKVSVPRGFRRKSCNGKKIGIFPARPGRLYLCMSVQCRLHCCNHRILKLKPFVRILAHLKKVKYNSNAQQTVNNNSHIWYLIDKAAFRLGQNTDKSVRISTKKSWNLRTQWKRPKSLCTERWSKRSVRLPYFDLM